MNKLLYIVPFIFIPFILWKKDKYTFGNPADFPTWDKITSERITTLHPAIRKKVLLFITDCYKNGYSVRITSALRTFNEQKKLYAIGRTTGKKGAIVTKAKPGLSYHNYGKAFDVITKKREQKSFIESEMYNTPQAVVNIASKYGFSWGGNFEGDFKDLPHFQDSSTNINTLYKNYTDGKKTADGYVIV